MIIYIHCRRVYVTTYVGQFETMLAGKETQFDQGANDQHDEDEHDGRYNANACAGCQD